MKARGQAVPPRGLSLCPFMEDAAAEVEQTYSSKEDQDALPCRLKADALPPTSSFVDAIMQAAAG